MNNSKTKIRNLGYKYRGEILSTCCVLEKDIEDFIMSYFVEDYDKWYIMRETLLDRFHFDGKISVLEVLIKKSVQENFKKQYGKLFSELRFVKDERNKFAHYVQFLSNTNNDFVTLVSFRDGIKQEDYSSEKYKSIIDRILRCIKEVRELGKNVHKFLPAQ